MPSDPPILSVHWGAIAALAVLAALLPLFILASGAPISDPDIARLATFHLRADFWVRAGLTAIYFPAIIALHFAMLPTAAHQRTLYLCGLIFFVAGNAIDLPFRAVQFLTVSGTWGADWLGATDSLAKAAAAAKIASFGEIAPAITFSFTLLFAVGRLLMGAALWRTRSTALQIAAAGLVLTGLWNLAAVLKEIPTLAALASLGSVYLWVWLAGIVALGTAGIIVGRSAVPPRPEQR
jgi:hypothetical protein